MRLIKGLITTAITMALLAVPAGALAKGHDRNHDRIPDKWEHKHHLSTRANVAHKDPDKDGLANLSEFRHHTDPQDADTDDDGVRDGNEVRDHTNPDDADTDDDGVEDGDEISGTVTSFDAGLLTIQLPGDGAGTVSGIVNDQTRIECDDDDSTQTATAAHDGSDDSSSGSGGSGDNSGPGSTDDNSGSGSTRSGSDDGANHDADDDDDAEHNCTSDLKPGARV